MNMNSTAEGELSDIEDICVVVKRTTFLSITGWQDFGIISFGFQARGWYGRSAANASVGRSAVGHAQVRPVSYPGVTQGNTEGGPCVFVGVVCIYSSAVIAAHALFRRWTRVLNEPHGSTICSINPALVAARHRVSLTPGPIHSQHSSDSDEKKAQKKKTT